MKKMPTSSKKPSALIAVLLVVGVLSFLSFQFISSRQETAKVEHKDNLSDFVVGTKEEQQQVLDGKTIEYFKSDILPLYPLLESDIGTRTISKVVALRLKGNTENSRAWVVQVDEGSFVYSFYYVTPKVQKKLVEPLTKFHSPDTKCTLGEIKTVGNELGFGRNLRDPEGYLILSSEGCMIYGGGGAVSVYKMSNGEKVMLSGNVPYRGSGAPGIHSGNAQGQLRGAYGRNQPQLVVDYTSSDSIDFTAYFDLQTGALKQLVRFE